MLSEKAPPYNLEAEEGVLGSALIDPEVAKTLRWLKPDDFYRDSHRAIWRAMQKLARQGVDVDVITLCSELKRLDLLDEIGGQAYLASLISAVPTSVNAPYYAQIVSRFAIARRAVFAASQIVANAYSQIDQPAADFRRACMDLIIKATDDKSEARARSMRDVLAHLQEETYNRLEGDLSAHLLLSGFDELDRMIAGFEPGDLVYLAARPRMGKSGLGQKLLLNIARQLRARKTGGTCDYVTLEMTGMQQARRMVSGESKINSRLIRAGFRDVVNNKRGDLDMETYSRFAHAVEELREEIGDTIFVAEKGMTIEAMRDHLTEAVATRDCRAVLVDQLDLFDDDQHRNENEHVSAISRALKGIAKDLNIVVLCLVQLNRKLEDRAGIQGKRPQLADLRMSGRLEMDADMVLFLHRPCVYGPNPDPNYRHYEQFTELWAGKLRENDAGGMIPLCFLASYASFSDWPRGWQRPPFENDVEGAAAWEKRMTRVDEGGN